MKKFTVLIFSLVSFVSYAEEKIVPLDIEPGYWETSFQIEQSQMIKDMLANLPQAQREMVLKTMESSMPSSLKMQCITEDAIKDMENQIRQTIGSQADACDLEVTKSTRTEFIGQLNCKGAPTVVHTKVINPKRQESVVTSHAAGMGKTKLNMIGEWKSENCPAGV